MSYVEPDEELVPPSAPVIQGVPEDQHNAVVRENAILKALPGADLSTPVGQMFASSYSGEMTPEAIRQAAEAVGVIQPPEPEPTGATPEQLQEQHVREQVGSGAPGVLPPPTPEEIEAQEDPVVVGFREMQNAQKRGLPRDKAAAEVIDRMVAGAIQGRPGRVVSYTPEQANTLASDGWS